MGKNSVNLVLGILSVFVILASVDAFTHIVGGSHGWQVPDNKTFYQDWAQNRTFGVGDRLVFPYRPGANNVVVVNKKDFDVCGDNDVVYMYFLGPTIINFTAPGDYYYYCGIGKHCEAGQKLHIQVGSNPGSSGSDPLPFKLETIGLDGSSVSTPAPAPATTAAPLHSSATAQKVGLVSAGLLFISSLL